MALLNRTVGQALNHWRITKLWHFISTYIVCKPTIRDYQITTGITSSRRIGTVKGNNAMLQICSSDESCYCFYMNGGGIGSPAYSGKHTRNLLRIRDI